MEMTMTNSSDNNNHGGISSYHDQERQDEEDCILHHDDTLLEEQAWYTNTRSRSRQIEILLAALLLVLVVDVALRCHALLTNSIQTQDHNPRWVPHGDLLQQDNDNNALKYTRDVGNHSLQGLALDQTILYEVHTLAIRVLQLELKDEEQYAVQDVVKRRIWNSGDFPRLLDDTPVAHIGGVDLCTRTNELWLATHSDGIDGVGGLLAVDPTTLTAKADRIVRTDYNLDWVACKDNVLYFGEFFNVKVVHRADLETLEPLEDLVIDFSKYEQYAEQGIQYVQSASFDGEGRLVLLGDDYQKTIYTLDITGNSAALSSTQGLLLGSETDGITFDSKGQSMLVGYNRQHSHEQVMGMEPMISIIQLRQQ